MHCCIGSYDDDQNNDDHNHQPVFVTHLFLLFQVPFHGNSGPVVYAGRIRWLLARFSDYNKRGV